MKRQSSFAIPFSVALLLNAAGIIGVGRLLAMRAQAEGMVPVFQQGESGLELTLLSSEPMPEEVTPAVPVQQPVVAAVEPLPEKADDPVFVEVDTTDDSDQNNESLSDASSTVRPEGPDRTGENSDADMLSKGVAGAVSPVAGIRIEYPLGPRLRGEQGSVMVKAMIDESGDVQNVKVVESSGYSGLDNAAMKAIKRTKYVPERRDGRCQAAEVVQRVNFVLADTTGPAKREGQ